MNSGRVTGRPGRGGQLSRCGLTGLTMTHLQSCQQVHHYVAGTVERRARREHQQRLADVARRRTDLTLVLFR